MYIYIYIYTYIQIFGQREKDRVNAEYLARKARGELTEEEVYQCDLYWIVGPEANHATLLGLKPLLDVHEMTNGLELEPFGFSRPPCQGMPLRPQSAPRWRCTPATLLYAKMIRLKPVRE